ncbi:MAG: 3-isopropylmalate dehydratase [Synergistaceae bacterium]|jgi:3-isopropylmalate/(R)-2-methylmalate dehydratase small subunit|nr:3-isopropylmalate dehydratase [Synergistaceae bacterium]
MSETVLRGKVWRFGDDINTDIISPAEFMDKSYEEIGRNVFGREFPGFAGAISKGDFVVAGSNFGSGSSRETAQIALKYAGVGAVIAKSYARIFFRNCVNVGLPVIVFDSTDVLSQGDSIEVNLGEGTITNLSDGKTYRCSKLPEHVMQIVREGGLKNYLKGYVSEKNRKILKESL